MVFPDKLQQIWLPDSVHVFVSHQDADHELVESVKRLTRDAWKASDHLTPQIMKVAHHGIYTRFTTLDNRDPPKLAEFLLTMLLKPSRVDAVTGDFKERFESDCRLLGQRRAVWRYWRRTFDSLWPLLRRAIGKALKWGAVIAAVRRLF